MTTQITAIVTLAVMLGAVLTVIAITLLSDSGQKSSPSVIAARAAMIVQLVDASAHHGDVVRIVETARAQGIDVALVDGPPPARRADGDDAPLRSVSFRLEAGWGVDVAMWERSWDQDIETVVVPVARDAHLVFRMPLQMGVWRGIVRIGGGTLVIVTLFVVLLSVYARRWIARPLDALADAAVSFGQSPSDDRLLSRPAPREIVRVAAALDGMRTRIRNLIDDRTRMLVAISHDLRTPLTRLGLRAERIADPAIRSAMQTDLDQIGRMLNETLDYLRDDARTGQMIRCDLPSLITTTCSGFADVGHGVRYDGPARLTWTCRPGAVARAIGNLVENGVKHGGKTVVVGLHSVDGGIEIVVADDGPGIPADLRERVFEPFFKGNSARGGAGQAGFGLGLSIARDAARLHGGDIALNDRPEGGLVARLFLPAAAQHLLTS
ncbi:ATP-binding protein [Tistrella bauzanensis]|nr:ATP-binding protein [Tistrella bauzanensis]